MASVSPSNSATSQHGFTPPAAGDKAPDAASGPSAGLVAQTRQEIRTIAAEIAELSRGEIPPADFYDRFLTRVVAALGAAGAAVWTVKESGEQVLEYQINFEMAGPAGEARRMQHARLLQRFITDGEAVSVPPNSGTSEHQYANPTEHLLLLAPLHDGQRLAGVVEIFQRPSAGPATQRGYLRFLVEMAELAGGYLKVQRLRHYSDKQQLWGRLEHFIRRAHHSLETRATAYALANEGRRLIECDRVSVVLRHGRRWRVEAISGVDQVETRAPGVRLLEQTVKQVAAAKEALWFRGDTSDLPPQLETAVHALIDETHAGTLAVIPLSRPEFDADNEDTEDSDDAPIIAALVIEQLQGDPPPRGFENRVDAVAQHGGAALANALDHESIFLLPLWRTIGRLQAVLAVRHLPKAALVLAGVLAAVAALVLTPAGFQVEGRGTLEPVIRREVFAGIDGTVVAVPVAHGDEVRAGQPLALLRSTSDMDVAVADLVGRKLATRERIASVERSLLGEERLSVEEQDRLSGQLFQLRQVAKSIETQLQLYEQKRQQLRVTSPIDGQVVTWNVQDLLLHRPVRKGQALMTVVDPAGQWELEVEMPERRMGHVARAAAASETALEVTFMLATHPGDEYQGRLRQIERVADQREGGENTVLLRVDVDKDELPDLRPGAGASARVHCGSRSIGYVWFHDLFEFVQSQILFRM